MSTKLRFSTPLIAHSPVISAMFSVLDYNSNAREWLLSNFINLHYNIVTHIDQFYSRRDFFLDCPFLHKFTIHMDQIRGCSITPSQFFINSIDLGHYIYVVAKVWYIPAYQKSIYYQKGFSHNLTIYGYDSKEEVFHIADHFHHSKYSTDVCSFSDIEKSLAAFEEENKNYYNVIRTYKVINTEYKFEIEPMVRRLDDHLNSVNLFYLHQKNIPDENFNGWEHNVYNYTTFEDRKLNYVFGLAIYDSIASIVGNERDNEPSRVRDRVFHLLYEHKVLMVERVKFLFELSMLKNGEELIKQAEQLRDDTHVLRNNCLMYIFSSGNKRLREKLVNNIEKVKLIEKHFLEMLLYSINC